MKVIAVPVLATILHTAPLTLKWIVHLKIIYSPSSCFKPAWVSFFCQTQKKIFWKMLETKQLMDHTMEVSGSPQSLI